MIFKDEPSNWQDLQEKVAKIFYECGCNAEIEKNIETVRGKVNIDVFILDTKMQHPFAYLCECKYWNKKISKAVVHGFRTVVVDAGAHIGYIISRKGFQCGSFDAAANTNVKLLDWHEFQSLMLERWSRARYEKMSAILDDLCEGYNAILTTYLEQYSPYGYSHRMPETTIPWGYFVNNFHLFSEVCLKYNTPAVIEFWRDLNKDDLSGSMPLPHTGRDRFGPVEEIKFYDYSTMFDEYTKMAVLSLKSLQGGFLDID